MQFGCLRVTKGVSFQSCIECLSNQTTSFYRYVMLYINKILSTVMGITRESGQGFIFLPLAHRRKPRVQAMLYYPQFAINMQMLSRTTRD